MELISKETSKHLLGKLKSGTVPIDFVEYLNVGNERWYGAAEVMFNDIATDGDSVVRFVNGFYGDGKTHFLGMLRAIGFRKRWSVSYVTAENTPLNRFDRVYSEVITNLTLPSDVALVEWIPKNAWRGGANLLGAAFSQFYREAYRPGDQAGLQKPRVLETTAVRVNEFCGKSGIDEYFAKALKGFVQACLKKDFEKCNEIACWVEGEVIKVPDIGIMRAIDQRYARNAMRAISLMSKRAGMSGILILLDEAERIMEQSRTVRNKSYGVLRDLLDNADEQGGMKSTVIYVASTPDMFSSQKGFAEYDALRSRLSSAQGISIQGFVDWRGVIIDLTKTPLPKHALIEVSKKIRKIHSTAYAWEASSLFPDEIVERVVLMVEKDIFRVSKPRMIVSSIANLLDIVEQNPTINIVDNLDGLLGNIHHSIQPQAAEKWN